MSNLSPPIPPADAPALLAALRRALPGIAARAPARDADGAFPAEDVAALREAGLLAAPLPPAMGGHGLGTEPAGAAALCTALRLIGRASLPLGRLWEGHVNALRLVLAHGDAAQRQAAARDARAGRLFAVWNTGAPGEPPLRIERVAEGVRLLGRKVLCSGAGSVDRALVTAVERPGEPTRLVLVPLAPGERADLSGWTAQGMRASASGAVDVSGLVLPEAALVGPPGAYEAPPDFAAGAWRFAAVQAGGIEALAEALRAHLNRLGRGGDPMQAARLGEVAMQAQTARLWVEAAALRAEAEDADEAAVAFVGLARTAVERVAMEALALTERSIGLQAFLRPHDAERIARDLSTYLRQPGPDRALAGAAAHVLAAHAAFGDLWD
ncbi:acyl-CoA dehydrogenase family protein [Paracraurococcus lichenis]|uniref:Acyl-CoA dehydrogenase family protein n=1 Tax=Paracraurococcus lichenis TaxID=3064888 RepID=A0ABT9DZY9_9PROT|nr:acyl-CoA dehydrogenase family protein [Paracraurococcus sp. LOR1-02]MDO9709478.1 acyl-CoA dehydrogenase family protein [Paracraurococcus sp. LOR1-02]